MVVQSHQFSLCSCSWSRSLNWLKTVPVTGWKDCVIRLKKLDRVLNLHLGYFCSNCKFVHKLIRYSEHRIIFSVQCTMRLHICLLWGNKPSRILYETIEMYSMTSIVKDRYHMECRNEIIDSIRLRIFKNSMTIPLLKWDTWTPICSPTLVHTISLTTSICCSQQTLNWYYTVYTFAPMYDWSSMLKRKKGY